MEPTTLEEVAKVLPIMDEIISPIALPVTASSEQRSRRSSGYASASSSPSAKRPPTAAMSVEENHDENGAEPSWTSSLYEVTLRWMFETAADPIIVEQPPTVQDDIAHVVNHLSDTVHRHYESASAIRIYLHLIQRHNTVEKKLPSFIDFLPIPSSVNSDDNRLSYALVFQDGSLASDQTSFSR